LVAYGHLVDGPGLGDDVRTRLLGNRSISGEALAAAERCRPVFRAEVDAALEASMPSSCRRCPSCRRGSASRRWPAPCCA